MLPETDGHTLEEIEIFYSRPGFNMFDLNIKHLDNGTEQDISQQIPQGWDNEAFSKL